MTRQLFHFVAGEQHVQHSSHNLLDAWQAIELRNGKTLAAEFLHLLIEAYDEHGTLLGKKFYAEWHVDMMRDTYGDNWQERVEHADRLLGRIDGNV